MKYIQEMHEGDRIIGHYLCKDKQKMTSKAGKNYFNVTLQDKTGILNGKIWDLNSQIDDFNKNQVIKIDAQITSFQGDLQANISRLRVSQDGEYQISDYMKQTQKDVDQLYQRILAMIDVISNEHLSVLLKSFFVDDPVFKRRFMEHPAAKNVHHNYMGGLIEHVSSVTEIAAFLAGQYEGVDLDLVIAGALLHDIGKMEELQSMPSAEYTDAGQLLGHIMIGYATVRERIHLIDGFPKLLEEKLLHIIISHHGELEYGSPKVPVTREAMIVHYADNIDAKMKLFEAAIEEDRTEGHWTAFNRLLNRTLYKN